MAPIGSHKVLFLTAVAVLVTISAGLATQCKRFEVTQKIIVKTESVSEVTRNSCRATGTLLDVGSLGVGRYGFCWSLSPNPEHAIDCSIQGGGDFSASFSDTIEGLAPGTSYHLWAYAENDDGREYGKDIPFTTLSAGKPVVETGAIRNITATSAECEYNVVSDGGAAITEQGICWNTGPIPTIEGPHATGGPGIGTFAATMEGLAPSTTYYVRAYAINQAGVAYGVERSFATLPGSGVPVLTTTSPVEFTPYSVICGGEITSDGGSEVTVKGVCWSRDPLPTVDDFYKVAGTGGVASFEVTVDGLLPLNTYYLRAFAVNSTGAGYGQQVEIQTLDDCGWPLVDQRDGNVYPTVRISEQCWMAQNLDAGQMIAGGSQVASDNGLMEKYCYNNDPGMCDVYGGLYTWDEMMNYQIEEGVQGVCPEDWHMPSDGEWKTLEMALGMTREETDLTGWRGMGAGGKLKAPGTVFWDSPNEGANNESGFNALAAGGIDDTGAFAGLGYFTDYWTSSWIDPTPWYRLLSADRSDINRTRGNRQFGTSVRCVRD
jgi:uncharacterized protein (TIGR02145 family)